MYCPNCGSKVEDGAIFCEECGARLQGYEEPEQEFEEEDALSEEDEALTENDGALNDEEDAEKKKPGFFQTTAGNITIGAAAACLVMAAIIGGVSFFNGSRSASTEADLLGADADGVQYEDGMLTDEQAAMLAPLKALMDQYSSQTASETKNLTWNNSVDNWGPVVGTIVNKRNYYADNSDYVRIVNDSTVAVSPQFLQEIISSIYYDYEVDNTLVIPPANEIVEGTTLTYDEDSEEVDITVVDSDETNQESVVDFMQYKVTDYNDEDEDDNWELTITEYDEDGNEASEYEFEIGPNENVKEEENPTYAYAVMNMDYTNLQDGEESSEYLVPDADTRYYSASELSGYSQDELRKARNEIYARHGWIFDSDDLREYFNSKSWYNGTTSPAAFDDSVLNKYEQANIETIKSVENGTATVSGSSGGTTSGSGTPSGSGTTAGKDSGTKAGSTADSNTGSGTGSGAETKSSDSTEFEKSWATIKSYELATSGYDSYDLSISKYFDSYLSFTLEESTLVDKGDYYEIQAVFNKPYLAPKDMKVGDKYTITTNELTGEKTTFVGGTDMGGAFCLFEEGHEDEYSGIYGDFDGSSGMTKLEIDSADRLDAPFYNGVLRIRKDAVFGYVLGSQHPYATFTPASLQNVYDWLSNYTAFDENGYVTQLLYYGD